MNVKAQKARERINSTKTLTLDERVIIITQGLNEIDQTTDVSLRSLRLSRWLETKGYEPMMFHAAFRVWLSRQ